MALKLWKSDGSAEGTVMIKDINPTGDSMPVCTFGCNASTIHVSTDGMLYFGAFDGVTGKTLWRSDGTSTGTFMLKNTSDGKIWAADRNFFEIRWLHLFFSWLGHTPLGYRWNSGEHKKSEDAVFDIKGVDISGTLYLINMEKDISKNDFGNPEIWRFGLNNSSCLMLDLNGFRYSSIEVLGSKIFMQGTHSHYGGTELFAYDTSNDPVCKKTKQFPLPNF